MVLNPLLDKSVREPNLYLKCYVSTRAMEIMEPDLLVDNTTVVHKKTNVLPRGCNQELPVPPPLPPNFLGYQRFLYGGSIPNISLRRYNPEELEEIRLQVANMLKQKNIRPSTSPYLGSPIIMIYKKTGEYRMCLDYRALNAMPKRNVFPLPRIDDLLDRLQGVTHFTTLDLAQWYYQMGIAEVDKEIMAFKTVDGLYKFNTITMGLTNAPSVFQAMVNKTISLKLKGINQPDAKLKDLYTFSTEVIVKIHGSIAQVQWVKVWLHSRLLFTAVHSLQCTT
jgi:hypothetical protein